jgi:hypothetical protein
MIPRVPPAPRRAPPRCRPLAEKLPDEGPAHEWREEVRRRSYGPREDFDRIGYARRVLDALRPPALSVLLRHGFRELRVEGGERWDRPGERWVELAIPRDASREEIVFALLACVGAEGDPYWSDVLLRLPDPVEG